MAATAPLPCLWGLQELPPTTRDALIASGCITVLGVIAPLLFARFTPYGAHSDLESTPLRGGELDEKGSATASRRSGWLDGCRFWLVFLIVAGHAVSQPTLYLPGTKYWLRPFIVWSATFHMPALALISGMCSRSPMNQARASRLFTRVLMPFLVMRVIRSAINCRFHNTCAFNPFEDGGIEWYLVSLLHWRLGIGVLGILRPAPLMLFSVAAGLLSGYYVYSGAPVGVERTLAFFPFFAAGYLLDPVLTLQALGRRAWSQSAGIVILVAGLLACSLSPTVLARLELGAVGDFNFDYVGLRIDPEHPYQYARVPQCGLEFAFAAAQRLPRYFISFTMVAAFMAALPYGERGIMKGEDPWWAKAGAFTMYPYLLHGFVLELFSVWLTSHPAFLIWSVGPFAKGGWFWLIPLISSLGFMWLSTSSAVRWAFRPLIEPDWVAAFFRDTALPPPGRTEKQKKHLGTVLEA